jgi:RimJ/RimL family protein N-acetyltransferase
MTVQLPELRSMSAVTLSVRAMREADIALIADYWSDSDRNQLLAMGVDRAKVPAREDFIAALSAQLGLPLEERQSYCTIWQADGKPIGHCNVNKVRFGCDAYLHLHVWYPDQRRRGTGSALVWQSVQYFFERLALQDLYCEPYALNPAPNAVLAKVGFVFVKEYTTIPGVINFEQPVKRWHLSRARYAAITRDLALSAAGPKAGS